MEGILDALDKQANALERIASRPKFDLAESQLRGAVLERIESLLTRLGYSNLTVDKKPVKKHMPARGKFSFHRLETNEGSVALIQPPDGTLAVEEGWEKVDMLLQALADSGMASVYIFTETESDAEIHQIYRIELLPTYAPKPPHLFQRAERIPGDRLEFLESLDESERAEQLRIWMGLEPVPPPDPSLRTDGFLQPQAVRDRLAAIFLSFGEHPFNEVFRRVTGKLLHEVVKATDFPQRVTELVNVADRGRWLKKLVYGVRLSRPEHSELIAIARRLELESTGLRTKNIEEMLDDGRVLLSPAQFRARQGRREVQVCRVEIKGDACGTAFLVGPDLVLTNYHVVEQVFAKPALATRLRFRFDRKLNEDGSELHPGELFDAHSEWEVDSSPYSQEERRGVVGIVPTPDELDYALIRLARPAGALPIGGDHSNGTDGDPDGTLASIRGWIDLRAAIEVGPHDLLMILQYPAGADLRMTFHQDGVIGFNDPEIATRLRYRVETLPGSSGAACFDGAWQITALHHLGDPTFEGFDSGGFQQGVPIARILERLERLGKLDQLPASNPESPGPSSR